MTPNEFQYRERAKQLMSFEGMQWDSMTPTDIDGFLDYRGKYFVYMEGKVVGKDLLRGQELALENATQSHVKAGHKAIAIVFEHNTPVEQDVIVKNCRVVRYYFKNEWQETQQPRTVKELIDLFLDLCIAEDKQRF